MTWEEAKRAMNNGKHVAQDTFAPLRYFYMQFGVLFKDDGECMEGWYKDLPWQKNGWRIVG